MPIIVPAAEQDLRTFKEVQDEVLALGFGSVYRDRIKVWINEGWHRLARTMGLVLKENTFNHPAGVATIAHAGARVRTVHNLTTGRELLGVSPADFQAGILPNAPAGEPELFTVIGAEIRILPTPDKGYEFLVRYDPIPPKFVNDEDTVLTVGLPAPLDDYWHVPINWAASRAYRNEDDPEMATFYFNEFNREATIMRGDLGIRAIPTRRQISGMIAEPAGPRFRFPGR